MPEFRQHDPRVPSTPLEAFLVVNETLRGENTKTIQAAGSKSQPKALWEGTFLRMKNAAPMAGFAQERSYLFEGMAVSKSTHYGVDLASTERAPIEAANNGVVVFAGYLGIYGNTVIVDHGLGLSSLYAHMSDIGVKVGQSVARGETLGNSGREIAAEVVVTASTGNAGAALAGMSAAVGQKAIIFAPKSAPQAKVAQLLVFGAKVILVDGTYDHAFDLTVKASNEFGWYCRITGYNPFTAEGKKTAALEIWEWWQTAHQKWHDEFGEDLDHPPLTVFVSVGDGNIISGIHKGFKDLHACGWLEQALVWDSGRRVGGCNKRISHPHLRRTSPSRRRKVRASIGLGAP